MDITRSGKEIRKVEERSRVLSERGKETGAKRNVPLSARWVTNALVNRAWEKPLSRDNNTRLMSLILY